MNRVRKLTLREHVQTRCLYEEIFPEDTQAFVEYYYRQKVTQNQIYTVEAAGEMAAMLHLNPYQAILGNTEVPVHYIVAVATKEKYRHQGMMSQLLAQALMDMYRAEEPFTFLMPAAEAIYLPFDFRYIYQQKRWHLTGQAAEGDQGFACRPAVADDSEALSEWMREKFMPTQRYRTYMVHTPTYFADLIKEQGSQKGEIVLVEKGGDICGYFFTTAEEKAEVREPLIEEKYRSFLADIIADYLKSYTDIRIYGGNLEQAAETAIPTIMARIVNLKQFVRCLSAAKPVSFTITVEDHLIAENNGTFTIAIDQTGGYMQEAAAENSQWQLGIEELVQLAFGYVSPDAVKMPTAIAGVWQYVDDFAPAMMNEVV